MLKFNFVLGPLSHNKRPDLRKAYMDRDSTALNQRGIALKEEETVIRTKLLYYRYKAFVLPVQKLCTGSTEGVYYGYSVLK